MSDKVRIVLIIAIAWVFTAFAACEAIRVSNAKVAVEALRALGEAP